MNYSYWTNITPTISELLLSGSIYPTNNELQLTGHYQSQ